MSVPSFYFTKRNQMASVLRRDAHHNAQAHPDRLQVSEKPITEMRDRRVQVVGIDKVTGMNPVPAGTYHRLAWGWDSK